MNAARAGRSPCDKVDASGASGDNGPADRSPPRSVQMPASTADIRTVMEALWRQRAGLEGARAHYRGEGQWVTIGGAPDSSRGVQHAGGTPVQVDSQGRITAGPESLEGKDLDQLDRDREGEGAKLDVEAARKALNREGKAEHAGKSAEIVPHPSGLGWAVEVQSGGKSRTVGAPETTYTDAREAAIKELGKGGYELEGKPSAAPRPKTRPEPQQRLFGPEAKGWREKIASHQHDPTPAPEVASKNPGVRKLEDGRLVGQAHLSKDELAADPTRFQYKVKDIDPETGTTAELKEVKRFRPEFAGQILVWHDPEADQSFVVNGHHRYALMHATGYEGTIPAFFIDAETPEEARAIGALANMAEGRGTAVDAAKFLRDTGRSVDDLRSEGISLKGAVASDGAALARLSDRIFHQVAMGKVREGRALAVARNLEDHAAQNKLWNWVERKESKKGGKPIPDGVIGEMAREIRETPTRKTTSKTLFGETEDEETVFFERNTLKSYLRDQLTDDARAFKAVSREGRAKKIEAVGRNVVDLESNLRQADRARENLWDFDREVNLSGELSDRINRAARDLADAPRSKKRIQRELLEDVRRILAGQETSPHEPEGVAAYHRAGPRAARIGATGATARRGPGGRGALGERFRMIDGVLRYSRRPAARNGHMALADRFRTIYEVLRYGRRPSDQVDPAKAREILEHGEVHGEPLTPAQQGMFGAAASRDYAAGWDESKHPRDEGGKFSTVEGRGGSEQPGGQGFVGMGDVRGDELPGLEGPFNFPAGELYYDPREGRYYDRGRDMYLENDEALRWVMGASGAKSIEQREQEKQQQPPSAAPKPQELFADQELNLPEKTSAPFKSKEELYRSAQRSLPQYQAILNLGEGMSKDLGADVKMISSEEEMKDAVREMQNHDRPVMLIAPLKGEERAARKVQTKYGGDWGRLQDVVRGTVAVNTAAELPGVINSLRTHMERNGWTFATRPEDRMNNPVAGGYRDMQLKLKSPDGQIAELQINFKPMMYAKEVGAGHDLYNVYRDIREPIDAREREGGPPATPEERAQLEDLEQRMNTVYRQAWAQVAGG